MRLWMGGASGTVGLRPTRPGRISYKIIHEEKKPNKKSYRTTDAGHNYQKTFQINNYMYVHVLLV